MLRFLFDWETTFKYRRLGRPQDHLDFHRHVYRELNGDADAKANLGRTSGRSYWHRAGSFYSMPCLRIYFDGSLKDGICGSGFVAFASSQPGLDDSNWAIVAWMCLRVEANSITAAELEALAAAHAFVSACLSGPDSLAIFFEQYVPWSYTSPIGM